MTLSAKRLSRRKLFSDTGKLVAGAALGAGIVGVGSRSVIQGRAQEVPEWPWPYVKLDPEEVRKRAYDSYYTPGAGCAYGAFNGIIGALADEFGAPYTMMPTDMFRWGRGGAVGWYTQFPFPTDKLDQFAKFPGQAQSVSDSPLCHVSISKWLEKESERLGRQVRDHDPERSDRCGKLTGDVAAHAVRLLNQWKDGAFTATYQASEDFAACMGCHVGKESMLDNVKSKMNCLLCHEPHM